MKAVPYVTDVIMALSTSSDAPRLAGRVAGYLRFGLLMTYLESQEFVTRCNPAVTPEVWEALLLEDSERG